MMSEYEIGYGHPPKSTRFKPGQSGNTKGRPKGSTNIENLLNKALDAKVTIETPNGTKRITKREAIMLKWVNQALSGDPKSIQALLPWIAKADEHKNKLAQMLEDVSEEDKKILKGFANGNQTNNTSTPVTGDIAE